jgi:hypothetical protein
MVFDLFSVCNLFWISPRTCTSVGTASIYCQIHLVADVGNTEKRARGRERGKEGRKGEE